MDDRRERADACIYLARANRSDPRNHAAGNADPTTRAGRQQYVRARFRNTQVAFVVADIDRAPPGAEHESTSTFTAASGRNQSSTPPTVQVSAPARLVLGPIDSNPASQSRRTRRRSSSWSTSGGWKRAGGRPHPRSDRSHEPLRPRHEQRIPAGLQDYHAATASSRSSRVVSAASFRAPRVVKP